MELGMYIFFLLAVASKTVIAKGGNLTEVKDGNLTEHSTLTIELPYIGSGNYGFRQLVDAMNNLSEVRSAFQFKPMPVGGTKKQTLWKTLHGWYEKPDYSPIILGPTYSRDCIPFSGTSQLFNTVLITYCTDGDLADREIYPAVYQTEIYENTKIVSQHKVLLEYNWKRYFYIVTPNKLFLDTVKVLYELDEKHGTRLEKAIIVTDIDDAIEQLKQADARIVMLNGFWSTQFRTLCKAYAAGLRAPKIVFVIQYYSSNLNCTYYDNSLPNFGNKPMVGAMIIDANVPAPENYTAEFGYTEDIVKEIVPSYYLGTAVLFARLSMAYKVALAANKVLLEDHNKSLVEAIQSDHNRTEIYQIMQEIIQNVDFHVRGISGTIDRFDNELMRRNAHAFAYVSPEGANVIAKQFTPNPAFRWTDNQSSEPEYIIKRPAKVIFYTRNGMPPMDGRVVHRADVDVNEALYGVVLFFAVLSCLISISIAAHQFWYREKRFMKLGSPILNILILLGLVLAVLSVTCHRVPSEQRRIFFIIRTVLFVNGFSLSYCTLFIKVYRVHQLFVTRTKKARALRDGRLLLRFLMAWMIINNALLIAWFVTDEIKTEHIMVDEVTQSDNEDIVYQYFFYRTTTSNQFYFTAALIVLQTIMVFCGAFLAFLTRNVKLSEVNDAKEIFQSIETVCFVAAIGLMALFFVPNQINICFGVVNASIVCGSLAVQLILFRKRLPFILSDANLNKMTFNTAGTSAQSAPPTQFKARPDSIIPKDDVSVIDSAAIIERRKSSGVSTVIVGPAVPEVDEYANVYGTRMADRTTAK